MEVVVRLIRVYPLNTSNAFLILCGLIQIHTQTGVINMMIDIQPQLQVRLQYSSGIGHVNGQIAGFIAGTTGNLTYNGGFQLWTFKSMASHSFNSRW